MTACIDYADIDIRARAATLMPLLRFVFSGYAAIFADGCRCQPLSSAADAAMLMITPRALLRC